MTFAIIAMATILPAACASVRSAASAGEKMLRIDGLRVSDGGSGGVPVVFHHGLGSDLEAWRGQLDHLRASRRAIAFDARGHGESDAAPDGTYTIGALAEDLDRVVVALGLAKFWLVGHSMAGAVLSAYAGKHPEKLAGLIYVDAVGDITLASTDLRTYFHKHDADMTPERLQSDYREMLGPRAKPETRRRVLAAARRMKLPAFAALRASMAEAPAAQLVARFSGPKYAVEEATGGMLSLAASKLPGVRRITVSDVSHWLMLDDPEALDAVLDQVLK